MKKRICLFIGLLVLVIGVALMGIGCNKAQQAQKEWENAGGANISSASAQTPAPDKPAEAPKQ